MRPGDLPYIPRGLDHDALAASDGTSTSLSASPMSSPWTRWTCLPAWLGTLGNRIANFAKTPEAVKAMVRYRRDFRYPPGGFAVPVARLARRYRPSVKGLKVRQRDLFPGFPWLNRTRGVKYRGCLWYVPLMAASRLNKTLTGTMLAYASGRCICAIAHERPGAAQVMRGRLHIGVLLAAMSAPSAVFADTREEGPSIDTGGYYFALDHSSLRRDIADVRYYYAQPEVTGLESADPESDFVFFSSGITGGFAGLWVPSETGLRAGGGPTTAPDSPRDVQFGIDWRPDVSGSSASGARQVRRSLVGSEIDRIGVRADVTALLFDESGLGTTAWRVSGMLGSTSLSLVSGDARVGGTTESDGGLLWDVGVGWSSGAMSLSAGYQSVLQIVDGNAADMAVLSLGADYAVLPGFSVFGEFNVIDDSAGHGDARLGTVVIVGTGLNF